MLQDAPKDIDLPEKTAKDHKNDLIMQIFKEDDDEEEGSAEFKRQRPQLSMRQLDVRLQAREQSHLLITKLKQTENALSSSSILQGLINK